RNRIDQNERAALGNVLVVGNADANDASVDFGGHRRAEGKQPRVVGARPPVDCEYHQRSEDQCGGDRAERDELSSLRDAAIRVSGAHASHRSHRANVVAQPIESSTTSGAGNSPSSPVALSATRATSAASSAKRAQTIHDGKYDPRMLREGEPSQPVISPITMRANALIDARGMVATRSRASRPPNSCCVSITVALTLGAIRQDREVQQRALPGPGGVPAAHSTRPP